MIIYAILLLWDFILTNIHIVQTGNLWMEANPTCVIFIQIFGQPYNLLIPFFILIGFLSIDKIKNAINEHKILFYIYYFAIIMFISGHLGGVLSWIL